MGNDPTYLERPGRRESAVRLLRAVQLIRAVGAKLTQAADARNPLDPRAVPDLPDIMHAVAHGHHRAGTFVPGDAFGGVLHGQSEAGPLVVQQRLVAGTQAAPVDLDEDFMGFRLRDVDLGHWGGGGVAAALADGRILLGRDADGGHVCGGDWWERTQGRQAKRNNRKWSQVSVEQMEGFFWLV